ncbi:MAG: di-trans,poly-cis-decaprenylcistransferase [Alphaproteobacteria bacterium HGW-Alphaproteobacteria-8]|nr:MAG: di-trans,poly-cis-decaprenylcistransferase [Alphaproteobacteria bacterium HGW-Alphaproteobacteria-8]
MPDGTASPPIRSPRHVAIIMDGNGRWAARRGLPRLEGHRRGVEALRGVVEGCADWGVETLTLFAFSTENWRRPVEEVHGLMTLFRRYLRREAAELAGKGVRVRFIGDRARLAHRRYRFGTCLFPHVSETQPARRAGVRRQIHTRNRQGSGLVATATINLEYAGEDVGRNRVGDARHIIGKVQCPFHAVLTGQGRKNDGNFLAAERETFQFPLDAHEKYFSLLRGVLVGIDNIAAVLKNKVGKPRHQPFAVGTR